MANGHVGALAVGAAVVEGRIGALVVGDGRWRPTTSRVVTNPAAKRRDYPTAPAYTSSTRAPCPWLRPSRASHVSNGAPRVSASAR